MKYKAGDQLTPRKKLIMKIYFITLAAIIAAAFISCGEPEKEHSHDHEVPTVGIPLLGGGSHSIGAVSMKIIATESDGLNMPRDLEFHPINPDQLWIASRDSSMVILGDTGGTHQTSRKVQSIFDNGLHFFAEPSAISFGDDGNFASVHETDKETQGLSSQGGTPSDFMGPTLWTSDLSIYNAGHSSHIDMMHNSPLGMGIAWEKDNVYWIFDGFHSSITRYDFGEGHGAGGTFHDDGVVSRYIEGEVKRSPDVVSHLEFDSASKLLYIADTGNSRIAVLDTRVGTRGDDLPNFYDCYRHEGADRTCSDYHRIKEASIQTFVDGNEHGISKPSGLALHNEILYVSSYTTGTIYGFSLDGTLVDWLDLKRPRSLGGLEFDSLGNLYVVDTGANEVIKIGLRK